MKNENRWTEEKESIKFKWEIITTKESDSYANGFSKATELYKHIIDKIDSEIKKIREIMEKKGKAFARVKKCNWIYEVYIGVIGVANIATLNFAAMYYTLKNLAESKLFDTEPRGVKLMFEEAK